MQRSTASLKCARSINAQLAIRDSNVDPLRTDCRPLLKRHLRICVRIHQSEVDRARSLSRCMARDLGVNKPYLVDIRLNPLESFIVDKFLVLDDTDPRVRIQILALHAYLIVKSDHLMDG